MRFPKPSHAVFALTMIALGIMGFVKGDFSQIWTPIPKYVPAPTALAYLCALVSLACGVGLLWRRTVTPAARVLVAYLALWFLLVRAPVFIVSPNIGAWWSDCKVAVLLAAAWVLYVEFASDEDKRRLPFATGDRGLRIARVLYGLALIPFGIAHFQYLENTASVVPGWLPGHEFWAYFTGAAFMVAGVAIVVGVYARLAAALSSLQMGLFFVLVWIPALVKGNMTPFQWSEFVVTWALAVAGWVVTDSYGSLPWLGVKQRCGCCFGWRLVRANWMLLASSLAPIPPKLSTPRVDLRAGRCRGGHRRPPRAAVPRAALRL
ncbi:MAG: DoxX family membrane protein [Acidobacteriota bacterium]